MPSCWNGRFWKERQIRNQLPTFTTQREQSYELKIVNHQGREPVSVVPVAAAAAFHKKNKVIFGRGSFSYQLCFISGNVVIKINNHGNVV